MVLIYKCNLEVEFVKSGEFSMFNLNVKLLFLQNSVAYSRKKCMSYLKTKYLDSVVYEK